MSTVQCWFSVKETKVARYKVVASRVIHALPRYIPDPLLLPSALYASLLSCWKFLQKTFSASVVIIWL